MNRTPLVLTASIAAALALPAAAAAHNAAAVPSCTAAVVTGALFAPGPNPVQVTVTTATGEVVATTVVLANGVPVTVPYVLSPGAHEVAVWLSWTLPDHTRRPFVAGRASVVCPTPAPQPPPAEQVPVVTAPGVPVAPPVVAPPKEGGVKEPSRTRASSTRWRVRTTACRIYARPPANAVPARRVPRLGQVRVRRDDTGRWAGFADRHRVTWVNGKITRVAFIPGAFCGRIAPAVTG